MRAITRSSQGQEGLACFIATLLFGFAAFAQNETPPKTTPADEAVESATEEAAESATDGAIESATDEAGEVEFQPEGGADPGEDLASETEEPLERRRRAVGEGVVDLGEGVSNRFSHDVVEGREVTEESSRRDPDFTRERCRRERCQSLGADDGQHRPNDVAPPLVCVCVCVCALMPLFLGRFLL